MRPIFLFPLALSVVGAVFILFNEDFGPAAKTFAVLLAGGSIPLLFVPAVHFLVPLAMQLVVCIWVALYWQIQR
jgi:hypothetical protein